MKKLLMLGAILVLGVTAFARDAAIDEKQNENEATVTVKARLVAENLVISDLEGNPIVLDFGRVSKLRDKGTSETRTGYMVRYVGDHKLTEGKEQDLAMTLSGQDGKFVAAAVPVTLTEISQVKDEVADTFDVSVGLNTYTGKMPLAAEKGHDYAEFRGEVFGTLDHAAANPKNNGNTAALKDLRSGDYLGTTTLKVTLNGGDDFTNLP